MGGGIGSAILGRLFYVEKPSGGVDGWRVYILDAT